MKIKRCLPVIFLLSCFFSSAINCQAMSSTKTKDGGTVSVNLADAVGKAATENLSNLGNIMTSAQETAEDLSKSSARLIDSQGASIVQQTALMALLNASSQPDGHSVSVSTNGSSTSFNCENGLDWKYTPPSGGGGKPAAPPTSAPIPPTSAPVPPTSAPTSVPVPPTSAPTSVPAPPTSAPAPPAPAPFIPPCMPNCDCSWTRCTWQTCSDGCGGTCSGAISAQPGSCGSADDKPVCAKPTSNLCGGGSTPSSVTLNSNNNLWEWTCAGICNGASASCSARKECSWLEVNP